MLKFRNLKIGQKIFLALGIMLLAIVIVGVMSFMQLTDINNNAESLANEYIPEVEIANNIERNFLETMNSFTTYGNSGLTYYLSRGTGNLEIVKNYIKEAEQLSLEYPQLEEFKQNVDRIKVNVSEYEEVINQTKEINVVMQNITTKLDNSSATIDKSCEELIDIAEQELNISLEENDDNESMSQLILALTYANNLYNNFNEIRLLNFKSQALGETYIMNNGLNKFSRLYRLLEQLDSTTESIEYKDKIEITRVAIVEYENSMRDYYDSWIERKDISNKQSFIGAQILTVAKKTANAGLTDTGEVASSTVNKIAKTLMIILSGFIISILVGLGFNIPIVKSITTSLNKTLTMIKNMSKGDLRDRLNLKSKDEIGQMANAMDEFADTLQENVVGVVNNISNGDLDTWLETMGENDQITPSLIRIFKAINGLLEDVEELVKATVAGKLNVRGDATKYSGVYSKIIENINKTLDTLVGHIDIVPTSLMIVDKDYNIQYMNNQAARMTGQDKNEATGLKCYDCFNTEDCNTDNCKCKMAIEENRNVKGDTVARPGDKVYNINYGAAPIKDDNGDIVGALEIVVDQTKIQIAQKKAEKIARFQEEEISKVVDNLGKLAEGDLNINPQTGETDEETEQIGESFDKLNKNLEDSVSNIREYIKEIEDVIMKIASADLNVEIVNDYKGDFRTIKEALNMITNSLNGVFLDINNAADQVSSGANQVSDGSNELSQGSTEQASSIEELTASITQIALQTRQNAVNADDANYFTEEAKTDAEQGNDQMKLMLDSMTEINKSSQNISKIIKVIDEIAFQTNILALNAAVEAARAGQHGRGFAVVAEEVRNLAQRSAKAAQETTDLIEGSMKKVEAGTNIANKTAEALEKIVTGVSKASDLVGQIAVASNEQATRIALINQGVEQVSKVTQTNSATAEESAAASEELAGQAGLLKELVNKFNLKDTSNTDSEYKLTDSINIEQLNDSEIPNDLDDDLETFDEEVREQNEYINDEVAIDLDDEVTIDLDEEDGKY